MNKLLSVLLSVALIWGSITPSFAQLSKGAKGIRAVQRMAGKSLLVAPVRTVSAAPRVAYQWSTLQDAVSKTVALRRPIQFAKTASLPAGISAAELDALFPRILASAPSAERSVFVLNTLPALNIYNAYPLTESQFSTVVADYRKTLVDYKVSASEDLQVWAQTMAAVSNMGFYGEAALDANQLVGLYRNVPEALRPYTEVVIGRALLAMNATTQLGRLARLSAGQKGLVGDWWKECAAYLEKHHLDVKLPAFAETQPAAVSMPADVKEALTEWSALNERHADVSVKATEEWVELASRRGDIVPEATAAEPAAGLSIQNDLTVNLPASGSLSLEATELPNTAAAPSAANAAEPAAEMAGGTISAAAAPAVAPKPVHRSFLDRFTGSFKERSANNSARRVLSQQYPLPTLLKQIIESPAATKWKEQAFVRLYEQGSLKEIIEALPEATQTLLQDLYTSGDLNALGERLLSLYDNGIISEGVSRISNAKKQESLLAQLDEMVGQRDWVERAKALYENTPVLPAEFSGVVPPVPQVDKAEILTTFRPAGWAASARGDTAEKNGMLYFKNGIPFYYRNSKGQLSSQPVGILSQEQANWYGRFLSSIHMADQPGLSVPKGFVLALDEMGQWKFIMPNGNRAIVEANPKSKKLLEEIQKNGSKQVAINTPYNTSDLLAMANLLEHNPDLNLELIMNAPDSMTRFLKILGSYIGLDSAGALTGPFKATLKGLQGLSNMLGNLVGGVGYMSPWAGGAAAGIMTKAGSIKTLKWLFGASILGLGYSFLPTSLGGLGMTGFQSAEALKAIPLGLMALPMVTAVFAGSLLGTQMNVFLNYFKDPVARTSAHLAFAETKQWSRLGLVASTAALGALLGVNWSIVVPAALTLVTLSSALLYNTPVYREFKAAASAAKQAALDEEKRLAALTPEERQQELAAQAAKAAHEKEVGKTFSQLYTNLFRSKKEVKDIAFRVKMVYASYAASLMMLGQTSSELFGTSAGQFLVGGFMLSTALMRRFASKQVSSNKMTDDQLTGMSLPLLALSGAGLALTPYLGAAGLIGLGTLGILHYVATAVPGQLDAARLQNLVSADLSKRKQAVLDYENMNETQRAAARETWDEMDQLVFQEETVAKRLELLGKIEKSWAGKATRDYSYFNGHGLIGITAAAGAGYLFADLGPQWAKDFLESVGNLMGDSSSLVTLNRLVLGYAASVAGVLAWKNWGLTKDFFSLFGKKKITAETISAGQVQPKDLGLTPETKDRQLVKLRKELKAVEDQLINYGINSERKMTKHLQSLVRVHNRLAAAAVLEREAGATELSSGLLADFNHLQTVLQKYEGLLITADVSVMLQREFRSLAQALCEDGLGLKTLRENIAYVPEGAYSLPEGYALYEDASQLVAELDQLAGQILNNHVGNNTYRQFITYQTRVNELFGKYKKLNPADSARVLTQMNKLNEIIRRLKQANRDGNIIRLNKGASSPKDVQDLEDILAGYAE